MTNEFTDLSSLCIRLAGALQQRNLNIVTIESCTGGALSAQFTELAGSSGWFERGYVTYSNDAKIQMVDVSPTTLSQYGAVSAEVAGEMAKGGLHKSKAQLAVSITGIAGPGGGSPEKPVGTVCFGLATSKGVTTSIKHFVGDRQEIREKSMQYVITTSLDFLAKEG